MNYQPVAVYDLNGQFIGYAIHKANSETLQSQKLWSESEVDDIKVVVSRLNNEQNIRQFWPDFNDPEVQELVNDPEWEPLELEEAEVIDYEASNIVYLKKPLTDERGFALYNPDGSYMLSDEDSHEVDADASTIVKKKAMVPNAGEAQRRMFKACEVVALRRAEQHVVT